MKSNTLWLAIILVASCELPQHLSGRQIDKNDNHLSMVGKYLYHGSILFDGTTIERFESGEMKRQSNYKDGLLEGNVETWFENGLKESFRSYQRGEKTGVHRGWWPNGKARFEYEFADGQYDGAFKEWYESGKPLHVFMYDQGKEVSAIGWRENGKTYMNFVVRKGRKYGLTNARLCYSLKDEQGIYQISNR